MFLQVIDAEADSFRIESESKIADLQRIVSEQATCIKELEELNCHITEAEFEKLLMEKESHTHIFYHCCENNSTPLTERKKRRKSENLSGVTQPCRDVKRSICTLSEDNKRLQDEVDRLKSSLQYLSDDPLIRDIISQRMKTLDGSTVSQIEKTLLTCIGKKRNRTQT